MPLHHSSTLYYQPPRSSGAGDDDDELCIAAKRYWHPESIGDALDPDALTLVLLHSTSFHKEVWEPVLERFFKLAFENDNENRKENDNEKEKENRKSNRSQNRKHHRNQHLNHHYCHGKTRPRLKIREAWALDCPNHGEAGQRNVDKLNNRQKSGFGYAFPFTCAKYAESVHRFLSAVHRDPDTGTFVDFRKRRLLGVGHSLGSNAMLVLQAMEPSIPFSSLIIVEPMMSPLGFESLRDLSAKLVASASERRDVWPTRAQALAHLESTITTNKWDARVKELFVTYALKPHPGRNFTEVPYHGFTTVLSREEEAAMYRDSEGATLPVATLNRICNTISIHLIVGTRHDLIPKEVQDAIIDLTSGRHFASVSKLSNLGHLMIQEAPDQVGTVMYEIMSCMDDSLRAKL